MVKINAMQLALGGGGGGVGVGGGAGVGGDGGGVGAAFLVADEASACVRKSPSLI